MPQASAIRRLFSHVAPRYDRLNHLLSLGADRRWRRALVSSLNLKPSDRALDLCTGTGDMALELAAHTRCFASDFTWEMLIGARRKAAALDLVAADALRLPFPADTFDVVAVAFGIRNLENLELGLTECHRVLRHGAVLAILEFSRPTHPLLRFFYAGYLHGLLPLIGGMVSRNKGAYRYLADSIAGFSDPESLSRLLRQTGYQRVCFRRMTGGIVAIHTATK